MHHLIENNKPGLVIYGSFNGYDKLYSLNVKSPNYYDDLYNVASAFKLIDGYKQYSIISRTLNKLCSIFSIYTGNKDVEGRNVFYTISAIYENSSPSSSEVFMNLFKIKNKFQIDCIDEDRKTIKLHKLDSFCNEIFPTLELRRVHSSKEPKDEILTIENDSDEFENILTNRDVFDYVDSLDNNKTVYFAPKAIKIGDNVTQIIEGSPIIRPFKKKSISDIIELMQRERMTKRFSFTPLSNQNTIVSGLLTLSFGDRYAEQRVYSTSISMEFIVDDNINGSLVFTPDDTNKYEKYGETKPFIQLTGYQGSIFNIKIEEKPSKKFKIKSDVPIYGLNVSCNGREIYAEQGYYTIYDQSSPINIKSTSHLPKDLDFSNFRNNDTITLLSNNIELEICEGNNKIPFSKEFEVLANGNRLSTNYINRSDLPIKIEVNSKKYFKNGPSIIPKDFTDSKHTIYLINSSKNIKVIGYKKEFKNSGIIGPEKRKPWYYGAKGIGLIISGLLLIILLGYLLWPNEIITHTCNNIVNGTPQFEKFCKANPNCENCKKTETLKTKETTPTVSDTSGTTGDVTKQGIDTIDQRKPENKTAINNAPYKTENDDIISCKNFSTKSLNDKISFCKDSKNKNCSHCVPSCDNYKHLQKETQVAYCKNPNANCPTCPKNVAQTKTETPINGTSEDKKEATIDCSSLDDLPVDALEKACKNGKFKKCAQCIK